MKDPVTGEELGGTSQRFQGHAKWFEDLQRKLGEESEKARKDVLDTLAERKELNAASLAEDLAKARSKAGVHAPAGQLISVELLPGLEIGFTPTELKAIVSSLPFATQVYSEATGIRRPSKKQILEFQDQIETRYPQAVTGYMRPLSSPPERRPSRTEEVEPATHERAVSAHVFHPPSFTGVINPAHAAIPYTFGAPAPRPLPLRREQADARAQLQRLEASPPPTSPIAARKHAAMIQLLRETIGEANAPHPHAATPHTFRESSPPRPGRSLLPVPPYARAPSVGTPHPNPLSLAESEKEQLFKRLHLAHEEKKAGTHYATLAPVPKEHREAEDRMRRAIESREEEARSAKERVAALRHRSHESGAEKYLKMFEPGPEGYEPTHKMRERIARHVHPEFTKEGLEQLRQQAEEEWKERIAPSISGYWSSIHPRGSGQHANALAQAKLKHEQKLRQDILALRKRAHDEALQQANIEQGRALEAAGTHATIHHHQTADQRAAEEMAMRERAMGEHGRQEAISALSHLGSAKQAREQAKINERLRSEEEKLMRPLHLLGTQAALVQGLNPPVLQSMISPPPHAAHNPSPSLAQAGAGLLGTLGQHFLGPAFKPGESYRGGPIKAKRLAEGGVPQWRKLTDRIEHDKNLEKQEELAKQFHKPEPFNYLKSWIGHAGNKLLSNLTHERPLELLGEAGTKTSEDQAAHEQNAMLYKAKSFDFYDKMRQSLQDQNNFLSNLDLEKQKLEENRRHHRENLGETARHHRSLEEKASERIAASERPKPLTPTDRKAITEAKARIATAVKMRHTLEKLDEVYSHLDTGPNIGRAIELGFDTAASTVGGLPLDKIQRARTLGNKYIRELDQAGKAHSRSALYVSIMKGEKPSFLHTKQANKETIEDQKAGFPIEIEEASEALRDRGIPQEAIDDYIQKLEKKPNAIKIAPTHHEHKKESVEQPRKNNHVSHGHSENPYDYSNEEIREMYRKVK